MIRPVLQDEAFLADIRAADQHDGNFRVWWLGQSGFLLQWNGHHILLDPYLSDSLTHKYASTDKPHTRMTGRVVDPARLDFIDIATSSHNHTDHLDAETLRPLMNANPRMKLVIPEANRAFVAERLGCAPAWPVGLRHFESLEIGPVRFSAVPAAHETVTPEYCGYVLEFGGWSVYHSGDTVLYDEMAGVLEQFAVDVALLPINGSAPERRVAGNLSGEEAARLARSIQAKCVIPCHYEMFTFNTADPASFVQACDDIGQRYAVVKCGERWSSAGLR